MDVLIDKLFFPSKSSDTSLMRNFTGSQHFLKNNTSLLQNIPSDYHELFEDNLFASDFNSSSRVHKFNFSSIFKSVQPNLLPLIPKLSPPSTLMQDRMFSSLSNIEVDMNPKIESLCVSLSQGIMGKKDNIESKGSIADHLILSLTTSPVNDSHFNITIAKKEVKPTEAKKADCNLSQQLANKKTKELQKRSKKRRRRQKKSTNKTKSTDSDEKIQVNFKGTPPNDKSSKVKQCDLICDVTLAPEANIQIVLPKLSSFLVTVESAEDDSDWDTNCDTDWIVDDSEFQLCGLYVGSFTAIGSCANSSNAENIYDKEISDSLRKLKKVNRQWEESMKSLETKQKSKALVSFATDDSLVTIFPVEAYERKGEWEIYATERLRFRKRINEIEDVLSPCLKPEHRAKIYNNLHKCNL